MIFIAILVLSCGVTLGHSNFLAGAFKWRCSSLLGLEKKDLLDFFVAAIDPRLNLVSLIFLVELNLTLDRAPCLGGIYFGSVHVVWPCSR